MDNVLQKIADALARLEQKLTSKNEKFLFEKSLLGAEIEKTQGENLNIKNQTRDALQKLDTIIATMEKNGKEN